VSGEAFDELVAAAQRWRAADPDPATRAEIDGVLARRDEAELRELFGARLEFGTAGIRGPLGPGPNRMNRAVVRRTTAGIARHLLEAVPDAASRGVVVARDARHGSSAFEQEAVATLTAHGVRVHRFDEPVPTPLAVAAVTALGAAAGVVVTASHNPPGDNGMKVVWCDGAQIAPPVDAAIAQAVEAAGDAVPPADTAAAPVEDLGGATGDHRVVRGYVDRCASMVTVPPPCRLRVATTALHGVAGDLLDRVLAAAGHDDVHTVASQRRPDPDFPTVAVPNPEDPAALAELRSLAARVGADVALANDPDGDRLAVAVPEAAGTGWRILTGDEVGAVLLAHLLERTAGVPDRLVVTTVVSSRLAGRMCAAAGVHFRETATGFKWLCRPGLEHPGWHQVLLYEEALGYAVGPGVRDKDGIAAAVVLLDALGHQQTLGRGLPDVLDDLARAHGAFVTSNGSVRTSRERLDAAFAAPRTSLGGRRVVDADRPAADVLRWFLDDDTRVVVRPSGTEPKVKYYCEAVEQVGRDGDVAAARQAAAARLEPVVAEVQGLLGDG